MKIKAFHFLGLTILVLMIFFNRDTLQAGGCAALCQGTVRDTLIVCLKGNKERPEVNCTSQTKEERDKCKASFNNYIENDFLKKCKDAMLTSLDGCLEYGCAKYPGE